MPAALLDTLCDFADTQSLLQRVTEQEVAFKPAFARNMLTVVVELYRWYRTHTAPLKLLDLQPHVHFSPAALMNLRAGSHTRKSSAGRSGTDGSDDGMETTDIAGEEEEEGQEDGEEEVSDFDGEFALAEPDTGDEMVVDDGAQMLEDSDSGGEQNAQVGHAAANMFAVGL